MSNGTLARQLVESRLVHGRWGAGETLGLRIDQALLQDGTGPTIIRQLDVLDIDALRTDVASIYVDHNLTQVDHKHPDDHVFLRTGAERFGLVHSPAGNGISHPVHLELFGRPGTTLLGCDSHTVGAGAVGQLSFGAGGTDVTLAMAGYAYEIPTPQVWGIRLEGRLPPWVSAKDVILELLRRHGVRGGQGRIIEYHGPGLDALTVWDRHVIANMGAELGAVTSVFPSDAAVREFLEAQGRGEDFVAMGAAHDATYDVEDTVDLSSLTPLIAVPHSPDNVVPVEEVAGLAIGQAYLGSSANPGYRDFAVVAEIVRGRRIAPGVSLDVNPSTRRVLGFLTRSGYLLDLIAAGGRLHQAGCNGCVGMGQAPASDVVSLRTTPRNFKGRTGTADDCVYLASPETIAASALAGRITDPRTLGEAPAMDVPLAHLDADYVVDRPDAPVTSADVALVAGPNIKPLPRFDALPDDLRLPVLLVAGDDVSTDDIMPLQQEQAPWRSDTDKLCDFVYSRTDPTYAERARATGTHCVVAGRNYGQGSARDHAALCSRYLGVRAAVAVGFARIYHRNLVNWGILPLTVVDDDDLAGLSRDDVLVLTEVLAFVQGGGGVIEARVDGSDRSVHLCLDISDRQAEILVAGGALELARRELAG
jgi:aconitate hydratase